MKVVLVAEAATAEFWCLLLMI